MAEAKEESLTTNWNSTTQKWEKINDEQIFKNCAEEKQSLVIEKSCYEKDKPKFKRLADKYKFGVDERGKNNVRFKLKSVLSSIQFVSCTRPV